FSADVRFRGDSVNHWAFPNKSWRIALRDGKFYQGMNEFNLNVPRVRTQIANWLGYDMAERLGGLLVPHAEFVHFRLNRKFDGVRLLLEQPNQDFLQRNKLPVGKIFVGDVDSEQIYGGEERPLLYLRSDAWDVKAPSVEESNGELQALVDVIKNEQDPYHFYDRMQSLVEMPALINYMALLELVGSVHVDETHNGKLYFNPDSGKFSPIVWDTVAYFWKNEMPLDMGTNALFRVTNSNPGFREAKDKALWNAIHGSLAAPILHQAITNETSSLRPDMYAFALKLHANDKGIHHISNREWEESIAELHNVIDERHAMIRSELAATHVAYKVSQTSPRDALLGLQVRSRSGLQLNQLTLHLENARDGQVVVLQRRGLEDVGPQLDHEKTSLSASVQNGKAVFTLGDHLFSKRKYLKRKSPEIVPATYVYTLSIPKGASLLEQVDFDAHNAVSSEKYTPVRDHTLSLSPQHKKNIVWWDPDSYRTEEKEILKGVVEINSTREVGPRTALTIQAGTTVKMAPGASLFINGGRLVVEGTEDRPVRFVSQDPEKGWGVLALRNSNNSLLEHVTLSGGTRARLDFVDYEGALSFHESTATLRSVVLLGDYLSARDSTLSLEKCRFENIFPFYIRTENARIHEKGTKKVNLPATLPKSILGEPGFGTSARAEREFKYTLRADDLSKYKLDDLAKRLQKALAKKGDDRQVWNAPQFTQTDYYIDDDTEDFVFRDIYFDTPDDHAYRKQVSYRLRNRYKGWKAYKLHVKQQDWPAEWPYRLEFQAKTGRQELGRG
ncbi:MAG: CotH kinase family protein, partial [Bdellovibrionales bacterium]|nr:CotH kinase family protein [Bdellovibrionales bacterium]